MKDPVKATRQRQAKEQADAVAKERARQEAVNRQRAALIPQVQQEIRAALTRLEMQGYPGGQLRTRKGKFGRKHEYVEWDVSASDPYTYYGDEVADPIKLTSTGTLYRGLNGPPTDPNARTAISQMSPSELQRALAELKRIGISRYIE